jgi:hypothetical protein
MQFDIYVLAQKEHNKDLMRQAEHYRLVQQALAGRPRQPSLWIRLLSWLKEQINNAGCLLQKIIDRQMRSLTEPSSQYPCGEKA